MAVPSSGLIRLSGIFSEINEDDYSVLGNEGETLRLSQMFDGTWGTINTNSTEYPTNSNPDKMSEFYNYDHDAAASTTLTSFSSSERQTKAACGYGTNLQETYYLNGSTSVPNYGDEVYSDSGGNTPLQAGQYKIGPFAGTYYNIVVAGNAGGISSRQTCP